MATQRKLPRLVAALACIGTLALGACSGSDGDSSSYRYDGATRIGSVIPSKDRKPAPKLDGTLLSGSGSMSASAHRGKPTVLAFWASWCGPCKTEMPQLSQLNTELGGKVGFIGVDSRDDGDNARAFVSSQKISFPSVVDENGALPQKLGNVPAGLPFTLVIDKSGKVAAIYVVRYGAKDLDRALSTLLKES